MTESTVVSGTVVLWAAHVYSHGLGESVHARRRLGAREIVAIARREGSILLAAVLPVAAVTLGAAGVLSERLALWLALGLGVAALTVQALRYARLERLSGVGLDGLRRWIEQVDEMWDSFLIEPEEFIDAGDSVFVASRISGRGRGGVEAEMRAFAVWTLREGKVSRFRGGYRDRAEALEAAGLRE